MESAAVTGATVAKLTSFATLRRCVREPESRSGRPAGGRTDGRRSHNYPAQWPVICYYVKSSSALTWTNADNTFAGFMQAPDLDERRTPLAQLATAVRRYAETLLLDMFEGRKRSRTCVRWDALDPQNRATRARKAPIQHARHQASPELLMAPI